MGKHCRATGRRTRRRRKRGYPREQPRLFVHWRGWDLEMKNMKPFLWRSALEEAVGFQHGAGWSGRTKKKEGGEGKGRRTVDPNLLNRKILKHALDLHTHCCLQGGKQLSMYVNMCIRPDYVLSKLLHVQSKPPQNKLYYISNKMNIKQTLLRLNKNIKHIL